MNRNLQADVLLLFTASGVLAALFQSLIPILIVAAILAVTALFQVLWNDTIPAIFALRRITFWQAFRLLLIAWILFGGVWIRWGTRP